MPVSTKTGSCRMVARESTLCWRARNSGCNTRCNSKTVPLKRCASSWCASRCARNRRLARLWLAAKLAHKHPRGARLKIEPCNPLPEPPRTRTRPSMCRNSFRRRQSELFSAGAGFILCMFSYVLHPPYMRFRTASLTSAEACARFGLAAAARMARAALRNALRAHPEPPRAHRDRHRWRWPAPPRFCTGYTAQKGTKTMYRWLHSGYTAGKRKTPLPKR